MNNVKRSRGEFFSADLAVLDRLANHGATAHEISAALVLMRGVSGRSKILATRYGVQSICVRLGVGSRKAQKLLCLLASDECPGGPIVESMMEDEASKDAGPLAYRWRFKDPMDNPALIYLPNLLVDGKEGVTPDGGPPLRRILKLRTESAQLDALRLMLHSYDHEDMEDSGGINPRTAFYQRCEPAKDSLGENSTVVFNGIRMHEFRGSHICFKDTFLDVVFSHIDSREMREQRCLQALGNLLLPEQRLLYPVTAIWDKSPEYRNAGPRYTLYVHDFHAAQTEPTMHQEIHNLAFDFGALDPSTEFFYPPGSENIVGTGRYRYIELEYEPMHPMIVFRPRFRAHTRDTGIGMEAEQERNEDALEQLRRLAGYAANVTNNKPTASFLDEDVPF